MKQSTFLPRLGAYCAGLPVLLIIGLFSRRVLPLPILTPLLIVALFASIWGQARIRRTYPQDFSQRGEWAAFGVFLLFVTAGALLVVKW
jgi:hypothetical protein